MSGTKGALAEIRATYGVPAYKGSRILFCGTPAVIVGAVEDVIKARMLADGRHVPAGTVIVVEPENVDGHVVFLDGQTCGNCDEPLLPAFDFNLDGPNGWLHSDGSAQCIMHAEGPTGIPADMANWPTEQKKRTSPTATGTPTGAEVGPGPCRCDGATFHTAEQNAKRRPFLVNDDCPIHGTEVRSR